MKGHRNQFGYIQNCKKTGESLEDKLRVSPVCFPEVCTLGVGIWVNTTLSPVIRRNCCFTWGQDTFLYCQVSTSSALGNLLINLCPSVWNRAWLTRVQCRWVISSSSWSGGAALSLLGKLTLIHPPGAIRGLFMGILQMLCCVVLIFPLFFFFFWRCSLEHFNGTWCCDHYWF